MSEQDLETALRGYLRSGEHIRWTGRPAQGLRLSPRDFFVIPFAVLWTGIFFFAVLSSPPQHNAPPTIILAPIGLIGLYLMGGRLVLDAWMRARTLYAVTDQRALLLRAMFSEQLFSEGLSPSVRVKKESNGRGTIEFGSRSPLFGRSFSMWAPWLDGQLSFVGVDDVMTVYRLIAAQA